MIAREPTLELIQGDNEKAQKLPHKVGYRPEIDGLRAIAILSVLFFHGEFGFPGGYIGVDIFFVISGFLITTLIWESLEHGRFGFVDFWERRARRIVPALVAVTLFCIVAGLILLLPSDLTKLGKAIEAQCAFIANIHYFKESGYFSPAAGEKPLLHTWSLAVEEQFYLVIPILLWAIYRFHSLRSRFAVLSVLTLLFLVSLGLNMRDVERRPDAAFYLTQGRAWELLLGSIVVFLPAITAVRAGQTLRQGISAIGLACILTAIFFYDDSTSFPGAAALLPCGGTAMLIWATGQGAHTLVGSLLSLRPMVAIGLISYSLYLWHWPLLAFSKYSLFPPPSELHRIGMLALAVVLAILSWRYIETPFRKRNLGISRKSMFLTAGAGLAVAAGLGFLLVVGGGFPQRFSQQALIYADAKFERKHNVNLDIEDIAAERLVKIGSRGNQVRPTVIVWGDSHAMASLAAFDAFLTENGLAGRAATTSSTAPVLNWFSRTKYGLGETSIAYNNSVFAYISKHRIPHVVLVAHWTGHARKELRDPNAKGSLAKSLVSTIRQLKDSGAQPWLMLDVPVHSFDVPKALALHDEQLDYPQICAKPSPLNELETLDAAIITEIVSAGGRILDPKPRFLDPTGRYYQVKSEGVALYRDGHHLTSSGARLMLLPLLRQELIP